MQKLAIWYDRGISPLALILVTLAAASLLGYLSWQLVESPALRLKHRAARRTGPLTPPVGVTQAV